jgi:hypothetical protein
MPPLLLLKPNHTCTLGTLCSSFSFFLEEDFFWGAISQVSTRPLHTLATTSIHPFPHGAASRLGNVPRV